MADCHAAVQRVQSQISMVYMLGGGAQPQLIMVAEHATPISSSVIVLPRSLVH